MGNRTVREDYGQQRGSALLETAVLATLLVFLTFAVVDVARAVLTRMDLEGAVRDGATVGALAPTSDIATIESRVRNGVRRVDLSATPISIRCHATADSSRRLVAVSLTYSYPMITPIVSAVAGPWDIAVATEMERFAPGLPCEASDTDPRP
jgi:Flp pilus assembly protein TadG